MNESCRTHAPTARWPWLRAVAFAVVSSSIGVFGHALAMGTSPSARVLLVSTIVMTAYARLLVTQRVAREPMLLGITVAQLLVHATMLLTAPTVAHHMLMNPTAHTAATTSNPSLSLMVLLHLIAIALGAVVLLQLERAAWAHVKAVAGAAVAFIARVARTLFEALSDTPAPQAVVACADHTVLQLWNSTALSRRGPPVRPAFA